MPMDMTVWLRDVDESWKSHCIGWELRFAWLPQTCHYSNKTIWLKRAYRGTAMWTGPGEPAYEYRWVEKHEYLLQRIKGAI